MNKKECNEKIERLEREIKELKESCKPERKFKVGDWVCFNHGEYPEYFSEKVGKITHFSYKYSDEGIAQFKHAICGGWDDDCLRHAHPEEIKYAKSNLPFIYNNKTKKTERVFIDGDHFRIGESFDTKKISKNKMSGKEIISYLLEANLLSDSATKDLQSILENMK